MNFYQSIISYISLVVGLGIPLYAVREIADVYKRQGNMPILNLRYEPLGKMENRMLKRMFDVVFSGFFLVTVFPFVYLIVGSIIKLTSPGPVFFKQMRTGLNGVDFVCYKFRSMKVNDEAAVSYTHLYILREPVGKYMF